MKKQIISFIISIIVSLLLIVFGFILIIDGINIRDTKTIDETKKSIEVEMDILKNSVKSLENSITDINKRLDELINTLENLENECFYFELKLIEPLMYYDMQEYLYNYKLIMDYYNIYTELPGHVFDKDELNYMYKCIETETYEAPFYAKVNVAITILNRIESEGFPDNPINVITEENQFAYGRNEITEDTKLALEYAFLFKKPIDNAIGFRSDKSPETWNGWERTFDDGYHSFYKLKGE